MGGDDLVIENCDVGLRRHRRTAFDDGERAVRQPALGLARPDQLDRGRADDNDRVGVVGLDRRQRLNRLAEPLLIGDQSATRFERVTDSGPLEWFERAAELLSEPVDRFGAGRLRLLYGGSGSGVLLAQAAQHRPGLAGHANFVQRDELVELLNQPRVDRHCSRSGRCWHSLKSNPRLPVPEHVQSQVIGVNALDQLELRRWRLATDLKLGQAARRSSVEPRRALLADHGCVGLSQLN